MLTQAMWDKDAGVLQLPHVTKSIALKAKDKDVESVYELLDAEDSVRGHFERLVQATTLGRRESRESVPERRLRT